MTVYFIWQPAAARVLRPGGAAWRRRAAPLAAAQALHREDAEGSRRMAREGLALLDELVPGGQHRLLTHCNTGALVSWG